MAQRRSFGRLALRTLVVIAGVTVALILPLRWLPPLTTSFMIITWVTTPAGAGPMRYDWVSRAAISSNAPAAVMAAEDQKFFEHAGFDLDSIEKAYRYNQRSRHVKGASTISQQVARTLFLTPARNWVRKGAEAYLTVLVEFVWPKKRILEAYLNLVDFGHGNFGAAAAAQAYFRVPAAAMSPSQSARLAAILPNPDKWKATRAGKRRLNRAFARTHEATENGMDWCVR